ncbi:hypothetical protein [Kibdelosporangium phytohabitans]|uniref:hypothetical protein n=1 Tax=Kibdelosporangium phytohabitans TaxID=860235 RepID=UPI003B849562
MACRSAGEHPSPIDVAHVTTTSTYKQHGGPSGELILLGADHDHRRDGDRTTLARRMQRATFPWSQGTPNRRRSRRRPTRSNWRPSRSP